MKHAHPSIKTMFFLIEVGAIVSMLSISLTFYAATGEIQTLFSGGLLTICALIWMLLLTLFLSRRLCQFSNELCQTMDSMISGGKKPSQASDSEMLLARIHSRLSRLYGIMQESQRKVNKERQELQALISDISHQVKTPISNLKMITDTLLTRPVAEREQTDFLWGIQGQADTLDFLLQALVKTSRLETGAIDLKKKDLLLIDTLAQAMSGIVYSADNKEITVTVDCPDRLRLPHDSRWTAEALFNLLDNAVKYTPAGGSIRVVVQPWEMYVRIDIADTGRGIPECYQASIFRRFWREEAVRETPGVGIGLYLAREIVTRQGGYIKVTSDAGKGSVFSVFLPCQ